MRHKHRFVTSKHRLLHTSCCISVASIVLGHNKTQHNTCGLAALWVPALNFFCNILLCEIRTAPESNAAGRCNGHPCAMCCRWRMTSSGNLRPSLLTMPKGRGAVSHCWSDRTPIWSSWLRNNISDCQTPLEELAAKHSVRMSDTCDNRAALPPAARECQTRFEAALVKYRQKT